MTRQLDNALMLFAFVSGVVMSGVILYFWWRYWSRRFETWDKVIYSGIGLVASLISLFGAPFLVFVPGVYPLLIKHQLIVAFWLLVSTICFFCSSVIYGHSVRED